MKYSKMLIFLLSAGCASLSIGNVSEGQRIGGACEYRRIDGWAVITGVTSADPDVHDCKDAVEVIFTFAPDDPRAPRDDRFADTPDAGQHLRVGAGLNPSRAWVESKGLVKGAIHRCIRSEIIKGACTPVVFTFPELDMEGWQRACFGNKLSGLFGSPPRYF